MRDRYAQCDSTCTVDCGACKGAGPPKPEPDVRRRCRACLQPVRVYRPTGTTVLRAVAHNWPAPATDILQVRCSGSYGPTDDLASAAREDTGTRRWLRRIPDDYREMILAGVISHEFRGYYDRAFPVLAQFPTLGAAVASGAFMPGERAA